MVESAAATGGNDDGPPRAFPKFVRDVGINVLANLIAAAIIYLLGVAAGILPRSAPAMASALVALTPLIAYPLLLVAAAVRSTRLRLSLRVVAAALTGVFLIAIAWSSEGMGTVWRIAFALVAVAVILGSVLRLREEGRDTTPARGPQKQSQ